VVNNAVEVRDLVVERGGNVVLPGLNLDIAVGTVTGLLGPSGCGKTTLIRAIAGVQIEKSGSVTVMGEPDGSPANRQYVGYVTQSSSMYPDLTIAQNLAYFCSFYDVPAANVDRVMVDVDLAERRDSLVGNLSGGQRARVSLAAALLMDADVLLLDEPTVGLDPVLRRDLWQLFHGLAGEGRTLLVSSHVMDEATRCDRILLMRDGRILANETPDGLRVLGGSDDLEQAFLNLAEGRVA
jgi:ABC-2 type transport system ATP-binding protein